jgi:hypothetical protein
MITLVLHLLRLLPFLCGGHRQLALENLALRGATATLAPMRFLTGTGGKKGPHCLRSVPRAG